MMMSMMIMIHKLTERIVSNAGGWRIKTRMLHMSFVSTVYRRFVMGSYIAPPLVYRTISGSVLEYGDKKEWLVNTTIH